MKRKSTRLGNTLNYIAEIETSAGMRQIGSVAVSTALRNRVNNLTPADKTLLNNALKRGGYTANKPSILKHGNSRTAMNDARSLEKQSRKIHRALILIYSVRSTKPFASALLEAAAQVQGIRNLGVFELTNRLERELNNVTMQQATIRQALNQVNWAGWDGQRYRPLRPGCAIGQRGQAGPGTLGCFVTNAIGEIFILSNMHVLRQGGLVGDNEIIQPPHMVGGSYVDVVADYVDGETTLDAAIAKVRPGIQVTQTTTGDTPYTITGHTSPVYQWQLIKKLGCSTGLRRGEVVDSNAFDTPPRNMHGIGVTRHQIKVARDDDRDQVDNVDFQVQGDSGTVICDTNSHVLGLLNVKHPNDGTALATLIQPILNHFNVAILGLGVHTAPRLRGNIVNFRTRTITPGPGGTIVHVLEWDSSTGNILDLGHILVRERVAWPAPAPEYVQYIIDPEPLENYQVQGHHYGLGNNATSNANTGQGDDTHGLMGPWKPNTLNYPGPNPMRLVFRQQYEFSTDNGNVWALIPNSQYTVTREIAKVGEQVRAKITKINDHNNADRSENSQVF